MGIGTDYTASGADLRQGFRRGGPIGGRLRRGCLEPALEFGKRLFEHDAMSGIAGYCKLIEDTLAGEFEAFALAEARRLLRGQALVGSLGEGGVDQL